MRGGDARESVSKRRRRRGGTGETMRVKGERIEEEQERNEVRGEEER